jgi:hypothetical protein
MVDTVEEIRGEMGTGGGDRGRGSRGLRSSKVESASTISR